MRLLIRCAALAATVLLVVACAATLPPVTPSDAERSGVALDVLQRGRERYVAKCSGCHALYAPLNHSDDEWRKWVETMKEEQVPLTEEDERLILAYLRAMNSPSSERGESFGEDGVVRKK